MVRGPVSVEVVPPPRVDPAGAVVFWSNLLGLLRPTLVRWWHHGRILEPIGAAAGT
jgi:hypothetical protein